MTDQAEARAIALSLPEAVEADDHVAFSVATRAFAWVWMQRVVPKKPRVPRPDVLAVRVASPADKELLIGSDPAKFFTEPHDSGFPAVLVRLAAVGPDELRELLTGAWRCQAPQALVAESGL